MKKKKIVVLTGAGISRESGLQTFRDGDGLWEGYNVYDVATPEAWAKNPALVQEFYNMRRKAVLEAEPNAAHKAFAQLEQWHNVTIITQNIDNLHERAGSTCVMHLHGEITKAQSTKNSRLVYDINGWELKMGDQCEAGSQLRPFIVWFGEAVPKMEEAALVCSQADVLIVVGTSLVVYPAAGLVNYAPASAKVFVIDPVRPDISSLIAHTFIQESATTGVPRLIKEYLLT